MHRSAFTIVQHWELGQLTDSYSFEEGKNGRGCLLGSLGLLLLSGLLGLEDLLNDLLLLDQESANDSVKSRKH